MRGESETIIQKRCGKAIGRSVGEQAFVHSLEEWITQIVRVTKYIIHPHTNSKS